MIEQALYGAAQAFNQTYPRRALCTLTEGLAYTRAQRAAKAERIASGPAFQRRVEPS